MNFLIHKPSEFIPEVTDTVLLMDRVRSAFMKPFEAEKNVSRKIHNAFKNRYFMVFSSL